MPFYWQILLKPDLDKIRWTKLRLWFCYVKIGSSIWNSGFCFIRHTPRQEDNSTINFRVYLKSIKPYSQSTSVDFVMLFQIIHPCYFANLLLLFSFVNSCLWSVSASSLSKANGWLHTFGNGIRWNGFAAYFSKTYCIFWFAIIMRDPPSWIISCWCVAYASWRILHLRISTFQKFKSGRKNRPQPAQPISVRILTMHAGILSTSFPFSTFEIRARATSERQVSTFYIH
jgi:hypothetical protein